MVNARPAMPAVMPCLTVASPSEAEMERCSMTSMSLSSGFWSALTRSSASFLESRPVMTNLLLSVSALSVA